MRAGTIALVALMALGTTPAGATELSSEALRSLAARALNDRGALRELRAVGSVDGVPVDLSGALRGAGGERLAARLRLLAANPEVAPVPTGAARARARSILDGRRFSSSPVPRPFKGVLDYLGRRLAPLGHALARGWAWLARRAPGGDSALWAIVGLAAVAATLVLTLRMARRRERVRRRAATARPSSPVADPAALERAAAAAERAGDLRGAIRLRFQAGLLRLDRARVIEWRPSLTTAEIARSVRSPEFASLARRFDEIVYGGRVPLPEDAATARRGWAELIEEA